MAGYVLHLARIGTLALTLMDAERAAAAQHDVDEHPFRMPGAPKKTVPAPSPWFTGKQLLQQLDPPSAGQARETAIAEGTRYLMGVYDATESGLWCYTDNRPHPTPKQPPEVMRAATLAYLRKLPATALSEKASVLVVQMWRERWPCPPEGCCIARGY
jgi:hypothetical protein